MAAIRGVLKRRSDDPPLLPWVEQTLGLATAADVRLDNRRELLDTFRLPSSQSTLPDWALLLYAWRTWGEACPTFLVGDYAFAIWDTARQTLFCARDHIGVRPFYYNLTADRCVFASAIRDVMAVPGVSDALDDDYVVAALADQSFYHPERTYLSSVRRLPPGHSLTVTRTHARRTRYWSPSGLRSVRFSTDDDYAQAARELLARAVADRLRSGDPVGVHLSGGLDSSAVAVLTAAERRRRGQAAPLVFAWQPAPDRPPASAEHARIEAVCAQEGLTAQYCPSGVDDVLTVLKRDPTLEAIDSTMLAEAASQRQAAEQGVRLMLSGWGGDESLSFGGRGYHAELLLRGRWWRLVKESRVRPWSSLRRVALDAACLVFADSERARRQIVRRSVHHVRYSRSLLHPDLRASVRLRMMQRRQTSIRATLFWLWDRGHLAERMESWAESGGRSGLDYTFPLLDRRVMEFVAGLPPEQFVRGPWRRWVMRSAMDGLLPYAVCWQPDKSEPVRIEHSIKALQAASEEIGRHLSDVPALPARAKYLDMPRLMAHLRSPAQTPVPAGKLIRALQFLDY